MEDDTRMDFTYCTALGNGTQALDMGVTSLSTRPPTHTTIIYILVKSTHGDKQTQKILATIFRDKPVGCSKSIDQQWTESGPNIATFQFF